MDVNALFMGVVRGDRVGILCIIRAAEGEQFMYGFVKRAVLKWVKVGVQRVEKKNHLPQRQKRDVLWNDCTAVIVLPAK